MLSIHGTMSLWTCLILISPAVEPAEPPPGGGRLTVTREVVPGSNSITVEFVRDATLVRTKVTHYYNVPTRQSSVSGDLLPVYLVVVGRAPAKVAPLRNVEDLFKSLKAAGYSVSVAGKPKASDSVTYILAPK